MSTVKRLCIFIIISFTIILADLSTAEAAVFSDVKNNHWAAEEIDYLSEREITRGFEDGKFKPTNEITRGEAAVMLVRALGLKTSDRPSSNFKDVPKKFYAYDEIATVVDEGIFNKGSNFYPQRTLTRGEMAKILVEAYDLKTGQEVAFRDLQPSHWAYDYIKVLAGNSITTGLPDLMFGPQNQITRAEFAVFIARVENDSFIPEINILPQKMNDTIYYPLILGNINPTALKQMNDVLYEQGFSAKHFYDELMEMGKEYNDPLAKYYTFTSNYDVKLNDNTYISILFDEYEYAGGVHGLGWKISYNFDLDNGRLLELKDLFRPNTDYVTPINNEIKRQIRALKQKGEYFELEPFYSIERDTESFYLTPNGVGIFFSVYEYTPYAYGIPNYVIPYSSLQGILK